MTIQQGTKATVMGVMTLLNVPFDQEVKIGDYIVLSDGLEYILEEVFGRNIYVRA